MGLNIKNQEVERLATEIAAKTGESKTEAIRVALEDRRKKLGIETPGEKRKRVMRYLETEVWPKIPPELLGKGLSKEEQDELCGYGPDGH